MNANETYLKLMANKIIKHRDNWKDNPNKYTGLFMIITPILNTGQRAEFNIELRAFQAQNNGIGPETAEKICYNLQQPYAMGQKLYLNKRLKSERGSFDRITKILVNPNKMERSLRNLSMWLLVKFKHICNESGVNFEKDEIGISDIRLGTTASL